MQDILDQCPGEMVCGQHFDSDGYNIGMRACREGEKNGEGKRDLGVGIGEEEVIYDHSGESNGI
jgi:hypothetical protein